MLHLSALDLKLALPFTKSPELHSTFKIYYSKEWQDAFIITLHNFFSTLFTSVHILSTISINKYYAHGVSFRGAISPPLYFLFSVILPPSCPFFFLNETIDNYQFN